MRKRPAYTLSHTCYRCRRPFRSKELWPVGTRMRCDKCGGRHAARKRRANDKQQVERGVVSLASICRELCIDQKDARRILRRKYDKPTGGWSFTREEAERIKAMLKEE